MQRPAINGPLIWSLVFIGVTCGLLGLMLPPVIRAAWAPVPAAVTVEEEFGKMLAIHHEELEQYRLRFDGRSAFYQPDPPVRRAPPPPPRVTPPRDTTPKPDPPQPPAAKPRPPYSGPPIKGFGVNQVWFNGAGKELRIAMGETKDGIEVVAIDAPWTATVMYRGFEYDLPMLQSAVEKLLGESKPEAGEPTEAKPATLDGLVPAPSAEANGAENRTADDDPDAVAEAAGVESPDDDDAMSTDDPEYNPAVERAAARRDRARAQEERSAASSDE